MKLQTSNSNPATATACEEIDLSLLEDSLRLTPWERVLENDRALALVRMLEEAQAQSSQHAHR
jgi:hypothetical protein